MAAETNNPADDDRRFFVFNAIVSTIALAILAWLLLLREGGGTGSDLSFMPAVNAALNGTAACLLTAGFVAIRRKRPDVHRYLMVAAFAASSLFLAGYLAYHYAHGDTRYEGPHRALYLTILASHVLLSMGVVPMALSAFWFAWKKRFATHKKVTRILLPAWLYVSVTGVVIYFMLHQG
jgi:putative membrane protein